MDCCGLLTSNIDDATRPTYTLVGDKHCLAFYCYAASQSACRLTKTQSAATADLNIWINTAPGARLMYSSFVTTSYTYRLCLALCLHLACACFVAKVVRRAEAGWRRVCAVTPVLAVNCLLPAVFHDTDEVVTKSMLLICLFWLSNFKALALCLDRGPLLKQLSLNRLLVVYLIPIVLGNSKAGRLTTCNTTAIASMCRPSVNSTQYHWAVSSERSQTSQVRSASTYTAGSHVGQTSNFGRPFLAKAVVLACMTFTLISYGDSLSTLSTHILYGKYLSFDNPSLY